MQGNTHIKKAFVCSLLSFIFFGSHTHAQKTKEAELSEVHKNNISKIVFSNSEIIGIAENEANFIKNYNYGDQLFCKVYLPSSLVAYIKKNDKNYAKKEDDKKLFRLKIFLDETEIISYASLTPEQFSVEQLQTMNSFGDEIFQKNLKLPIAENRFLFRTFNDFWIQAFKTATAGTHKITVKLLASIQYEQDLIIGAPIAIGQLMVIFPAVDKNNPDLCFPEAVQRDAELEKRILNKYNEKAVDGLGEKVLLMSKSWEVARRKGTSLITHRVMEVCIITRKQDKCYKLTKCYYAENFDGVTYDPNSLYMRNIGNISEIQCKCLE